MAETELETVCGMTCDERKRLAEKFQFLVQALGRPQAQSRDLAVCVTHLQTAQLWFEKATRE